METTIPNPPTRGIVEFGVMPNEYLAFDPIVGQCSAAHAEWLRRVRDSKQYKNLGVDWGDFCREHVGLSADQATQIIGILEEFGPDYFNLAALTPITPEEFRTVASKVKGRFFCANGQAVPLIPRNARKIAAMVERIRRPVPAQKRSKRSSSANDPVTLLDLRCREVTAEFRRLAKPQAQDVDRLRLASILRKSLSLLGRIEMELGIY